MRLSIDFFATQYVWHSRVGLGSALAGYRYVVNRTALGGEETIHDLHYTEQHKNRSSLQRSRQLPSYQRQ